MVRDISVDLRLCAFILGSSERLTSGDEDLLICNGDYFLEPYDPNADDGLQYVERMELMFAANDFTGEAKAFYIGGGVAHLAPERLATKTLNETATLTKHFSPPPSEVILLDWRMVSW